MKKIQAIFSKKLIVFSFLSLLMILLFSIFFNPIEAKNSSTALTNTLLIATSPNTTISNSVQKSINPPSNSTSSSVEQVQALTVERTEKLQFLPEDMKKIAERGKLVVAVRNANTPPFIMIKQGCENLQENEVCINNNGQKRTFYGLDIKIAQGIVAALNGGFKKITGEENLITLELNASQAKFDELVQQVFTKKADIAISKLSASPERSVMIKFSDPYLTMNFGLLVNRKRLETAQNFNKMEKKQFLKQLDSYKIGVLDGSFSGRLGEKLFTKAEIERFPRDGSGNIKGESAWKQIITAVREDQEDEPIAAFRDELEIKLQVFNEPESAIYLETVLFTDIEDLISIGVAADKPQLRNLINGYLKRERINYTVDKLICLYPEAFDLDTDSPYHKKHCNVKLN